MDNFHQDFNQSICKERCPEKDRRVTDGNMFTETDRRKQKERRNGRERRKHKRFQVEDFTFIKVKSESDEDVGQLLDISKAGLSWRYFVNAEKPKSFYKLDIFLSGGNFVIAGIPFRTISNTELPDGLQFSPTIFRRSSVQFGHLTPNQISKLDYFFSQHQAKDPLKPSNPRRRLDESSESGLASGRG